MPFLAPSFARLPFGLSARRHCGSYRRIKD